MRRPTRPRPPDLHGKILGTLALALLGCTADILGDDAAPGVGPGAPGATPGGGGTSGGGSGAQACQNAPSAVPGARIRRLTRLELENTLAELLGDAVRPLGLELEADTFAIGYSTGDERGVSSNYVDALKSVAEQATVALDAASESAALSAACFVDETSSAACARTFLQDFGGRAWRRPLEAVELDGLARVYVAGRATVSADEQAMARAGLDYATRAILQSPQFIFRTELGPVGAGGDSVALTPFETAAALSYALTASPPDAELVGKAKSGELLSAEQLGAQGRRLLQAYPERFARQAERFVREWLSIDLQSPSWNKDQKLYPETTPALRAALDQETELYLRDWAAGASLSELLTTPRSFVSQDNALVYGMTGTSADFTATALDGAQRAGVLTLPSFLGSRAHTDTSSPVVRGIAVMRKLLCLEPPPVPAMVPPLPPADQSTAKTTRERFEQHTSVAFCSACHQVFDPMGYAFEHYDAIGRYRDQENGTPVDSSGAIVGTTSSDGPVADAIELSARLAASPDVHTCFVRQAYRFTVGRKETDADSCTMAGYAAQFAAQNLNLRELMLALVTAPEAFLRVPMTPEP